MYIEFIYCYLRLQNKCTEERKLIIYILESNNKLIQSILSPWNFKKKKQNIMLVNIFLISFEIRAALFDNLSIITKIKINAFHGAHNISYTSLTFKFLLIYIYMTISLIKLNIFFTVPQLYYIFAYFFTKKWSRPSPIVTQRRQKHATNTNIQKIRLIKNKATKLQNKTLSCKSFKDPHKCWVAFFSRAKGFKIHSL